MERGDCFSSLEFLEHGFFIFACMHGRDQEKKRDLSLPCFFFFFGRGGRRRSIAFVVCVCVCVYSYLQYSTGLFSNVNLLLNNTYVETHFLLIRYICLTLRSGAGEGEGEGFRGGSGSS